MMVVNGRKTNLKYLSFMGDEVVLMVLDGSVIYRKNWHEGIQFIDEDAWDKVNVLNGVTDPDSGTIMGTKDLPIYNDIIDFSNASSIGKSTIIGGLYDISIRSMNNSWEYIKINNISNVEEFSIHSGIWNGREIQSVKNMENK